MTFGEKAVGLTFNPSGDAKVQLVKQLFAQIIDLCNDARTEAGQSEKAPASGPQTGPLCAARPLRKQIT